MINLNSKEEMELFLERWNSGDPIKDWYNEAEIGMALAQAIANLLNELDHPS